MSAQHPQTGAPLPALVPAATASPPFGRGGTIPDDQLEAACERLAILYEIRQARKRHLPTRHLWQRLRDMTARAV